MPRVRRITPTASAFRSLRKRTDPMKTNDSWHRTMYDDHFAATTIDSPRFHDLADAEVRFLSKTLKLRNGAALLDVPCGTGRHSVLFARNGFKVTGVDINSDCLKRAKENRGKAKVDFRQGDMANLRSFKGKFDAVVNLFTSFGYFSTDQKNKAVLRELISTLKPGGKIALQLVNRDWLMKAYRPVDWRSSDGTFTLEARRYDPKTKYNEAQRIVMDESTGRAKRYFHQTRLYSKPEMVALMRECGLRKVRVYGDHTGAEFSKYKSSHPIYLGEKA